MKGKVTKKNIKDANVAAALACNNYEAARADADTAFKVANKASQAFDVNGSVDAYKAYVAATRIYNAAIATADDAYYKCNIAKDNVAKLKEEYND